jgi:hypothetical protein
MQGLSCMKRKRNFATTCDAKLWLSEPITHHLLSRQNEGEKKRGKRQNTSQLSPRQAGFCNS